MSVCTGANLGFKDIGRLYQQRCDSLELGAVIHHNLEVLGYAE